MLSVHLCGNTKLFAIYKTVGGEASSGTSFSVKINNVRLNSIPPDQEMPSAFFKETEDLIDKLCDDFEKDIIEEKRS